MWVIHHTNSGNCFVFFVPFESTVDLKLSKTEMVYLCTKDKRITCFSDIGHMYPAPGETWEFV